MEKFHDIIQIRKRSFIDGFSICMTVPLRPFSGQGHSPPTNIESTCFKILFPSIWIIGACNYTYMYL